MPHDWRLAFCTVALLEGTAILVLALMILGAYRKSAKAHHIQGMAASVVGTVGAIIARMWEGGMDDDPWMVFWFMSMFGLKLYFLWWFYDRRPGGHAAPSGKEGSN